MLVLPHLLLMLLPIVTDDFATQWGSFRGPNGMGVSASETLPDDLDPEANLAWKIPMRPGYSSPVVTDDVIFLTTYEGKRLFTVCVDRSSGEILWENEAPKENDDPYRGPNTPVSPTPATDGDLVYVLFPCFGLVAYDIEGEEVWRRPLGPFNVPHTMASSPMLAGDALVLLCDQDTGSFLVAIDKESGKERWRTERPGVTHSYSTPVIYQPGEGPSEIICSGAMQVCGYSLETGKKLWWVDGMSWQANTLPVVHDDMLYVHSLVPPLSEFGGPRITETWTEALAARDKDGDGFISLKEWNYPGMAQLWFLYDLDNDNLIDEVEWNHAIERGREDGGLFAIRLGGRGDVTDSHVTWSYTKRRGLPDYASPLVYDNILYLIKTGGIVTAMDLETGKVLKQGRLGRPDQYYASPVAAAGKIVIAGQKGQLAMVRAGADWEVLSVHDLREEIWATPAVANGQVIVRTQQALYCFE